MSFSIEYNRVIYQDKTGIMLLFIKEGNSSVYTTTNNLRARDWRLLAAGTEKELWKTIGIRAGLTEGGGLQRGKGWNDSKWISIEEYIKIYRSKILNARNISSVLDDFKITFVIEKVDMMADCNQENKFQNVFSNLKFSKTGKSYFEQERTIFEKEVLNISELYYIINQFPIKMHTEEAKIYYRIQNIRSRI